LNFSLKKKKNGMNRICKVWRKKEMDREKRRVKEKVEWI